MPGTPARGESRDAGPSFEATAGEDAAVDHSARRHRRRGIVGAKNIERFEREFPRL